MGLGLELERIRSVHAPQGSWDYLDVKEDFSGIKVVFVVAIYSLIASMDSLQLPKQRANVPSCIESMCSRFLPFSSASCLTLRNLVLLLVIAAFMGAKMGTHGPENPA